MQKTKLILLTIIIGVVVILTALYNSPKENSQPPILLESKKNEEIITTIENTGSTQTPDPQAINQYVTYSPSAITEATKNDGRAVLFFHAQWCPTCRAAETNILNRIAEIPENITIIKVDYDNSSELKKKYAVTYQHTFVQVDSNGEALTTWNGGDVDLLLQKVQ